MSNGFKVLLAPVLQQGAVAQILLQPVEVQIYFEIVAIISKRTHFTRPAQRQS